MATVGLALPTYGSFPGDTWEFFRELSEIADAGGIETLWVADHVTLPEDDVRANGGTTRVDEPIDAWVVLAMMAARTTRVRLGTEVTPLPLREPVLLAQTASSLASLSGGRAVLGRGGGWYRTEFEEAGVTFRPYAERMRQMRDGAGVVRSLLDGERVWEMGDFYELAGACIREATPHRVPIWFGGRSDTLLDLVAALGDGWIAATNASLEEVSRGRDRLRRLLEEAGRDPSSVRIAVPFVARVAATTEHARADIDAYIERGAFEGFAKELLGDATIQHGIWGSPEECARKLAPYVGAGVDHVILDLRPPDHSLDSARRICNDLLPLLAKELEP